MPDKNQIVLELVGKTTKLQADLEKVKKALDGVENKTKKAAKEKSRLRIATEGARRSLGAIRNNLLLVTFAFGGSVSAVNKLIQAYGQQELAERKLRQALGFTSEALLTQASALQQQTTFGDEAIIGVQALIGAFTKDEEQIKALTQTTLDLAAAKGMDLTAAADLVSKSFGSSTNALSRYGIQVEGAVGSTERLEHLTGNVAALFGGQASAQADTMTGAMQQASNAMGDAAESMGSLMEPAVIKIAKGFSDAATSVGNFFRELREADIETTIRRLEEMGVTGEALVNLKKSKLQDDLKEINDQIESMGGGGRTLEDVNAQIASLTEGAATGGTEQLAKAMTDRERISQNILILEKALASGSKERIELIAKEGEKRLIVDAIEAEGRLLTLRNQNVIKDNEAEIGEKIADRNEKQVQEAKNLTKLADKLKERRDIQQEINDLDKEDTPPPIINEDSLSAFDQFVIKQAERLDVLTKEKLLINRLVEEYPKLAESLGIVTGANKKATDSSLKSTGALLSGLANISKASKGSAIATASLQLAAVGANTASAAMAAITPPTGAPTPTGWINFAAVTATGIAQGVQIAQSLSKVKAAQYGMNEVVDEPTLILAGEAGAEQVSITPLESPNIEGVQGEGASVVVNVSGNVLTSDFVEGELADNIREAVRRGTDFGIG